MTEQLENIEKKVRQLVEEMNALRQHNTALSEENIKLKATLTSHDERVGELTQRLSNTQQALGQQRGNDETEGSPKLKQQIEQYIAEIDKCIAWLQNA